MLRIKDLLFPPRCGACQALLPVSPVGAVPMLCTACEERLKREMMTQCKECYLPLCDCRCVSDAMAKQGFVAHIKLLPFSDTRYATARGLVLQLKRSAEGRYYRALAALLLPGVRAAIAAADKSLSAKGLPPVAETVITYLPRTARQRRIYGVDQAALLARALARALGVRLLPLFRRKRGVVQKSLSRRARLQNARRSLHLRRGVSREALASSRLILVDDVVTTGASMVAAAELLRTREVMAVSIAFTEKQ